MIKLTKTTMAFIFLFSLVLAGCAGEIPTVAPTETAGEITAQPVLVGVTNSITRLDPATADNRETLTVTPYIYEGLTTLKDSHVEPLLATDWEVSESGLEYTFQLRPDVLFQDGTPFNADAVIINFNRWFDTENPMHGQDFFPGWQENFLGFKGEVDSDGHPLSFFDGVEKINEYIVLFHLNREESQFLNILASPYFAFASPTLLESAGQTYGEIPGSVSGTGPYKLAEWTETAITLVPNPDYWAQVPGESLEIK